MIQLANDKYAAMSPFEFAGLKQTLCRFFADKRVKAFAIFLASIGDEAERIQNSLPTGRGYVCLDTGRLPGLFKNLFSQQLWME